MGSILGTSIVYFFFISFVKGKLGFGFMRLPMIDDKVDIEHTQKMVDLFMKKGFNYYIVGIDGMSIF